MGFFHTIFTKQRHYILVVLFFVLFTTLFLGTPDLFAQQPPAAGPDLGLQFAEGTGLATTDIRVLIARIIRVGFGLLGIIAVVIVMYGGFVWMTANGDQGKVETAKKIIINGVIGLAIILSAFGITEFIIRVALGQNGQGTGGVSTSTGGQAAQATFGGGAMGRSIRAHYPDRGEIDVPRNTKVMITFAERVNDASIFDTTKQNQVNINFANVKIYKSSDAKTGGLPPEDSKLIKDVTVQKSSDQLTYSFAFSQYLGSPSQNVDYTVYLGAGVTRLNGQSLFGGPTGAYSWAFQTGTTIDLVPPQVESVTPEDPQGCPQDIAKCTPRNEVIQINFSEPIDPTTVTGIVPGFNLITTSPTVNGEFLLSNQYKTVTFIPTGGCGSTKVNSCGDPIFCLPGKTKIDVTIKAAALDPQQQGTAQALFPYTGVVDMAGNSLDGQGGPKKQPPQQPDGKAEGSPKDDFAWEFFTSDGIDIIPPKVVSVSPIVNGQKISLTENVKVTFDKALLASSLWGSMEFFYGLSTSPAKRDPWTGAQSTRFGSDKQGKVDVKTLEWGHYDQLIGSTAQKTYYYYPNIYSTLKDTRQNCFKPAEGPTTGSSLKCVPQGNNRWTSTKVGAYPSCDLTK